MNTATATAKTPAPVKTVQVKFPTQAPSQPFRSNFDLRDIDLIFQAEQIPLVGAIMAHGRL